MTRVSLALPILLSAGLALGVGTPADAGGPQDRAEQKHGARRGPAPATGMVAGWVPNNGAAPETGHPGGTPETPLGDLWTFRCPAGGNVFVLVDTKDDLDTGTSCLDPVVQIFDARGQLIATGDDEIPCRHPTACGYQCPALYVPCATRVDRRGRARGSRHSLVVRDFGDATLNAPEACSKGGGYTLEVAVYDSEGRRLSPRWLALGGGPARKLPSWVRRAGIPSVGPALDDEGVPLEPLEKQ